MKGEVPGVGADITGKTMMLIAKEGEAQSSPKACLGLYQAALGAGGC